MRWEHKSLIEEFQSANKKSAFTAANQKRQIELLKAHFGGGL